MASQTKRPNFYRYAYSGLKFTRVLPKDMKNLWDIEKKSIMKNIGNAFNMYLIWTDRLSYLLKHLRTTIILHILACFQINEIDESKLKSIFISIKIDNKYSTNTLYMCRGRMPFLVNIINLRNDLSNLWTFMKVIRASMLVINSVIYLVIV